MQPAGLRQIHHGQPAAPGQHIAGTAGVLALNGVINLSLAEGDHAAERFAQSRIDPTDHRQGLQTMVALQVGDLLIP